MIRPLRHSALSRGAVIIHFLSAEQERRTIDTTSPPHSSSITLSWYCVIPSERLQFAATRNLDHSLSFFK
ncbi:MAG: hypothetical protein GX887_02590 [Firmicutes bacterium]|nr:hypothetical protein [Bacillota bacterium]